MEIAIVLVFSIGYILIALEHLIKINKTATALVTGVVCWTMFVLSEPSSTTLSSGLYQEFENVVDHSADLPSQGEYFFEYVSHSLGEHLNEIAQILFFLMGAMTIVELVDAHGGFKFITDRINTQNPKTLLWVVSWISFILSAVLDNLTTTIVMISLTRKLIPNRDMRLFFAGMIIVAANAGGAWSPIGDVTTTMLWIGGHITAGGIVKSIFLPSVVCLLVPLLYLSFTLKGDLRGTGLQHSHHEAHAGSGKLMFFVGLGALISVPVFKTLTHLPPFMGMMLGLGVLWILSELINPGLDESIRKRYSVAHALQRIDMPSVLFFLGILLAVGALQSMGTLQNFAEYLNKLYRKEKKES